MSDPNEPPPAAGSGDAPTPPPPPPAPPSGGGQYGASAYGSGAYGTPGDAGAGGYGGGGGYGAPPSDPYGAPYGGSQPSYSPADAVSFGWRHFTRSPSTLLVPVLVIGIVSIIISAIVRVVVVGGMTNANSGFGAVLVAAAISGAITTLIIQVLTAGLYKGGLSVADGRGFALGELFEGWDKAQVIVAALIIGLLTLVGTLLCYLPALIVAYFTQFTIPFIVDKNMSATEAIRASVKLCTSNVGPTILWWLLALVCIIVGAVLCLVGLLVAAPVVLVGLAYTFRRLQGEPVVEPAPKGV